MELSHGKRRDRYPYRSGEDQEEASKNPSFAPSSSSSSSSSSSFSFSFSLTGIPQYAEGAAGRPIEREHLFDKVVMPSDVGKLNRLVIPKQYAEKYFHRAP